MLLPEWQSASAPNQQRRRGSWTAGCALRPETPSALLPAAPRAQPAQVWNKLVRAVGEAHSKEGLAHPPSQSRCRVLQVPHASSVSCDLRPLVCKSRTLSQSPKCLCRGKSSAACLQEQLVVQGRRLERRPLPPCLRQRRPAERAKSPHLAALRAYQDLSLLNLADRIRAEPTHLLLVEGPRTAAAAASSLPPVQAGSCAALAAGSLGHSDSAQTTQAALQRKKCSAPARAKRSPASGSKSSSDGIGSSLFDQQHSAQQLLKQT